MVNKIYLRFSFIIPACICKHFAVVFLLWNWILLIRLSLLLNPLSFVYSVSFSLVVTPVLLFTLTSYFFKCPYHSLSWPLLSQSSSGLTWLFRRLSSALYSWLFPRPPFHLWSPQSNPLVTPLFLVPPNSILFLLTTSYLNRRLRTK